MRILKQEQLHNMLLATIKIIGGLIGLVFGADRFVGGASAIAREMKISPLLIGLTIVAFGTSAPEMLVSASAAYQGNPGIALGNAIGSNIANVGLVLGATALLIPLVVQAQTLRKEFPLLWVVMLAVFVLMYNLDLTRFKAALMLVGLFAFMVWVVVDGKRTAAANSALQKPEEFLEEVSAEAISLPAALFWLLVGLVILVYGANILVEGSAFVARSIGISDAVIGLTIVAIGTSLPELAASLAGALKGEPDMAIGNIIGSNIFNLLGVIGIAGMLSPFTFEAELMLRDYSLMLLITGLLFAFCLWQGRGKAESQITRSHGFILLGIYIAYQVTIVVQALAVSGTLAS